MKKDRSQMHLLRLYTFNDEQLKHFASVQNFENIDFSIYYANTYVVIILILRSNSEYISSSKFNGLIDSIT